ncbi:hypothetical protein ZYGR_0Z00320 [Zygosaccharomyces rouxii]|uniref:ZYRO0G00814p n=2 Tax=Zygosaccharomyces rouxii TaxID=4956 RepID=C5E1R8_ZYGRC|nr:uncharacterized protein ZYRO0G00814g [Zygosaccharomyces rouxii]KAH9202109.1 hypothetical protein LQ764DRAFT_1275 [Zygosaccharomyces rouxii]GAV50609.1 hypothetical protein ZYGR_0Z00320 [Zygosaccharomyces rouxii]CAR29111.1 ZYRO0G00814p [Zygosaccharomyces rouxii]
MFNSLSLRKPNILDNISLNVPRTAELPTKGIKQERINTVIQATESFSILNENKSVSSRSSQSEFSDVVKLHGSMTQESGVATSNTNTQNGLDSQSVIESQPTIALFIGDLDEQIDEEILIQIFKKFKSLTSVKVCTDAETGKSLGYGYLNFSRRQDTLAATEEFNYRPIFGKEVRIMPSLRNTFYRKNIGTNIFFSNLPLENSNLTTRVFYDTFKVYGNILSCKLDKRKNIGFIYFDNDHAARVVIKEFNGSEFFGNKILCGIHFDKELRKFPEFEKRKSSLNDITIPKEQLTLGPTDAKTVEHDSTQHLPHPNAIFVKNLPPSCPDDEILDYFSNLGPVKSVFSSTSHKYESSWAFVTYKKGSDTNKAVKIYHGAQFKGRKLSVIKAESARNGHGSYNKQSSKISYRPILYLQNLSSVCNEQFLLQMCMEERIKIENLGITDFFHDSFTYSGYVKCKSKKDADKILKLLNNRLIGGCEVKITRKKLNNNNGNSSIPVIDVYHSKNQSKSPKHSTYNGLSKQPQVHLQSAIFPMPIYSAPTPTPGAGPMYYPQPMVLTPKIATFNSSKETDEQLSQILKYLRRQVKKGIDFLRYPTATNDENLLRITNYIFEHYWHCDLNQLTKFLLLMNANTQNESILNNHIEQTAKHLGFER